MIGEDGREGNVWGLVGLNSWKVLDKHWGKVTRNNESRWLAVVGETVMDQYVMLSYTISPTRLLYQLIVKETPKPSRCDRYHIIFTLP